MSEYKSIRIDIVERLSKREAHDLEQLLRSRVERLQQMEREEIFPPQVIEKEKQLIAEATAALVIVRGKQ